MASVPPPFQSNYPRGPVGQTLVQRPPGVYFDAISIASRMVQANYGVYVVSTLLFFVILWGLNLGFGVAHFTGSLLTGSAGFASLGLNLILAYVTTFPVLGLICIGVKHARGEYIQISDLFQPFRHFGPAAAAILPACASEFLFNIASFLVPRGGHTDNPAMLIPAGILLVIALVVALFLTGPLLMAATHSAMTGTNAGTSLQLTFRKLGWNVIALGFVCLLGGLIAVLGVLLCGVGLLITYPIATNVIALHYVYYFPPEG